MLAELREVYGRSSNKTIDAVAELIKCSDVTVKAFESLGVSNRIVDQLESYRNCERALIEQKTALARVTGAQP